MNILRESYRVLCRHEPGICIGKIQVNSPSRHYKAMHSDDHIGLLTIPELADMLKSVGFSKRYCQFFCVNFLLSHSLKNGRLLRPFPIGFDLQCNSIFSEIKARSI